MKRTSGFTLIELVVVMVLLGILAATALPRFVDLSSSARTAAVQGVGGALTSALSLTRTKRDISSTPSAETLKDLTEFSTTIWFTSSPATWPYAGGPSTNKSGTGTPSVNGCTSLFTGILNNPPVGDYTISVGTHLGTTGTDKGCIYTYVPDASKCFAYDVATGSVSIMVTNPSTTACPYS